MGAKISGAEFYHFKKIFGGLKIISYLYKKLYTHMKNKAELYSSIIEIQKKCGQGLSGIVKIDAQIAHLMDELVDEGLVIPENTGGSLGHPESNIFYMPAKGYNVWKDTESLALTFVRFYLGVLEDDGAVFVSKLDMARDPELLGRYAKWLEANQKELDVMLSLSEEYTGDMNEDFTDSIEWLKKRDAYKKNDTIKGFIWENNNDLAEYESATRRLIQLYGQRNSAEDVENIAKSEEDLKDAKNKIRKANRCLSQFDDNAKVQDVIS